MEFDHVQHTLDISSDSEDAAKQVHELCVRCRRLIFGLSNIQTSSECVAGYGSSGVSVITKENGSNIGSHHAFKDSESGALPSDGTFRNQVDVDITSDGVSSDDSGSAKLLSSVVGMVAAIEAITGRYMNQPTLLYPHIESLVVEPFDLLRRFIELPLEDIYTILMVQDEGSHRNVLIALEHLCYHIYNISKVVGLRRIIACAPNEVRFLVPATVFIEYMQLKPRECSSLKYDSKRWCLDYVFLAWLSLLVYTPFDLGTIWRDDLRETITLQGRIIAATTHYLSQSTKARDAAAIVLSRLYSRPDVSDIELSAFMDYCTGVLTHATKDEASSSHITINTSGLTRDTVMETFDSHRTSGRITDSDDTSGLNNDDLFATPPGSSGKVESAGCSDNIKDVECSNKGAIYSNVALSNHSILNDHSQIGVLTVLKQMLKRMSTDDLKNHIPHISRCLLDTNWKPSSSACRKLKASCLGRLAVHLLPSQYFCQRYRRMCRRLIEDATNIAQSPPVMDAFEIDERIECILEHLLSLLVDNDIRVRWASAKSIGRISVKLPMQFNDQIVEHILQIIYLQYDSGRMCFVKGEASVHGGCLALAEIIRNGILIPSMLGRVLDCVVLTLGFDVWRGKGSAGTAVRDASCYICWAVVRSFASSLLQPSHLIPMSKELVNMALFDISINCRRAAGAAIQELVGRVGNIPHGLDLIVLADYYSVANRRNAFLNVSFEISKLGFYTLSMIDNLLKTKLHHPDITTRRLAAAALGKISLALVDSPNGQLITRNGCPVYLELVECCMATVTSSTLGVMHGSLCALIQLLSGLIKHGELIAVKFGGITEIPMIFERKRLFRLKGGTIIREAICNLIKFICRHSLVNACLSISATELDVYKVILKDCIRNFTLDVQVAAAEALDDFLCVLFRENPADTLAFIEYLLKSLHNQQDHIAARKGYALALGSVPLHLVGCFIDPVMSSLCDALLSNYDHPDIKDAQTRQHIVISLIRLIGRISNVSLPAGLIDRLVAALEFGCNDFEIDSRGDVGSWVREVSIEAIAYMHHLRNFNSSGEGCCVVFDNLHSGHVLRLVKCLIGACLERMDNTRSRATFLFTNMFRSTFYFKVDWIWQRVFYGHCYEYDIARFGILPEETLDMRCIIDNVYRNVTKCDDICSTQRYSIGAIDPQNGDTCSDSRCKPIEHVDCDPNRCISVDADKVSDMYYLNGSTREPASGSLCNPNPPVGILPHELVVLSSIAQNISWSIENSYNVQEILENVLSDSTTDHAALAKSQSNASLRLPGYSLSPQCFEHFLWLLYIPSFSFIVVTALVQVLGGIILQQSWKGRSLEQVVVDFIHDHSNLEAFTTWGEFVTLKDLVMQHVLEIYRIALAKKNCRMCIRVVSCVRILVSHGVISHSPEFIGLLSAEPRVATNYSYLKCIVKCLQAFATAASDQEIVRCVLRSLLGFLDHQYPTLRYFAQSSLVLVFNDCSVTYSRETLNLSLDALVSSVLEEHADCVATIDRLKGILNL
ncbi:hypothetical protein X943_002690 [Babesia divergens]|uniref:Tubulin-folding cofactor D ARM repeats domain-containing protein n=1 Tax=Babesia divergens TaxID=32595 RepID=A0AAD9G7E5_BABDI|nr:hypothetical protein X943_002690 [Babesia divergens]